LNFEWSHQIFSAEKSAQDVSRKYFLARSDQKWSDLTRYKFLLKNLLKKLQENIFWSDLIRNGQI
jgi:hypothetical protein